MSRRHTPIEVRLRDAFDRIDDLKDDKRELASRVRALEDEVRRLNAPPQTTTQHPRYLDGSDPSPRSSLNLSHADHCHRTSSPSNSSPSAESMRRTIRQLREELTSTQTSLAEARSHVDLYRQESKVLRGQARQLNQFMQSLQEENRRLSAVATDQGGEMGVLRAQLDDAISLANTRGKELVGSQVFLTKADALSIAEVVERVEHLNHEIFQAAAYLGESIKFIPYQFSPEAWRQITTVATQNVGGLIAAYLVEETKKPHPTVNEFVVQVVGQVLLCKICADLVHSWFPDDQAYGDFLSALYVNIRLQEDPAVAGRWRSLTRRYMQPTATHKWRSELIDSLNAVMQLAFWQSPDSNRRKGFEAQLEHIFKAVIAVRGAIGEAFTSSDLELVLVSAGTKFDKKTMEDAWGVGGPDEDARKTTKKPDEIVAGTTGLGLRMIGKNDSGETVKIVSLPKVVFESTMRTSGD